MLLSRIDVHLGGVSEFCKLFFEVTLKRKLADPIATQVYVYPILISLSFLSPVRASSVLSMA